MKKRFAMLLCTAMIIGGLHTQVYANNYTFGETYAPDAFGTPTTSSVPADYSAIENVRNNKDMAYFPPSYGVFSGNIPTDPTSRFHDQDANKSSVTQIPEFGGFTEIGQADSSDYNGGSISSTLGASGSSGSGSNITIHYEDISSGYYKITSVTPYSDGSIGRIQIPRFGVDVKVYEGTDLATMRKGVAHFEYTSQWDGNVGFASHNRGSNDYFSDLKSIAIGDVIKYTTQEGTRSYRVFLKEKISETDLSYLNDTSDNIVTLITCVEGQSQASLRWCVQAREI